MIAGRVNRIVLPSGDQLWNYEFGFAVTMRGVPPADGMTYTRFPGCPGILQVIASHLPSGESPWLPVQPIALPMSIADASPPATGTVHRPPSASRRSVSFRLGSSWAPRSAPLPVSTIKALR